MAEVASDAPSPKLSRYRSQRAPPTSSTPTSTHDTQSESKSVEADALVRSRSRYKRTASVKRSSNPDDVTRPLPSAHAAPPPVPENHAIVTPLDHSTSSTVRSGQDAQDHESNPRLVARHDSRRTHSPPKRQEQPSTATGLFPPPLPPSDPSSQPPLQDGPPSSSQICAPKSLSDPPLNEAEERDHVGCFAAMFRRKRKEPAPYSRGNMTTAPRAAPRHEPQTIKPGGGGVVPGVDAPVSAINAGDRHVLVEYGASKTLLLPVTATTGPVDLIQSAAQRLSTERIDVRSAVLLESFGTVGVQRPLRRYERVRDVMNSWDGDRENRLVLVDPGVGTAELELTLAGAPRSPPSEASWTLLVSQKPGKWDERLVTLRSNGQLTMQKDSSSKTSAGGEQVANLCHLSDFDLYTPTPETARRKIKAPRRICYAVKSQQKTNMFESLQDFVYFFSTGDQATGDAFYAAVQGWRSWYLVHVLGEGHKPKTAADLPRSEEETTDQVESVRPVAPTKPTTLPPPLLAAAGFTKSANQFDTTLEPELRGSRTKPQPSPDNNTPKNAVSADHAPLANLGRHASTAARRPAPPLAQWKDSDDEFAANGLLGRTYSQRKAQPTNPILDDDTVVLRRNALTRIQSSSGGESKGQSSPRRGQSGGAGADLQRRTSQLRRGDVKLKPLVDLTPTYQEPPQHARKGRAFRPPADRSGPLVECATSHPVVPH